MNARTIAALSGLLLSVAGAAFAQEDDPAVAPAVEPGTFIVSDFTWRYAQAEEPGWKAARFDDSRWTNAVTEYPASPEARYKQLAATNLFGFPSKACWMWVRGGGMNEVYFRKRIPVPEGVKRAEMAAVGDDAVRIHVNGVYVGEAGTGTGLWGGRGAARIFDLRPFLVPGDNVIALAARDDGICAGVCLEIRLDARPVRDLIAEQPASVPPPPEVIPRHRPAFVYRDRTLEEIESFLDDRGSVKRNLACVLRFLQDRMREDREATVRAVLKRLDSADARTVQDTLATVSLLGLPEAVPDLESLLGGPLGDRARLLAVEALARVGSARHVPLLEKLLAGLGGGATEEIAGWIRLLGSETWAEREKAQAALRRIGSAAVPQLEEALESEDLEVRVRARDLLDVLRMEESAGIGPLLRQALERGIRELREKK
jgi:hypothetical protein